MTQFGDSIKEVNIKGFNPVSWLQTFVKSEDKSKSLSVNIQKENFQIEFP